MLIRHASDAAGDDDGALASNNSIGRNLDGCGQELTSSMICKLALSDVTSTIDDDGVRQV